MKHLTPEGAAWVELVALVALAWLVVFWLVRGINQLVDWLLG